MQVTMRRIKEWVIANKAYLLMVFILIWFTYMGIWQITGLFRINSELGLDTYDPSTGSGILITWYMVIAFAGIVWYAITKNKYEAVAITLTGFMLIWYGTENLLSLLLVNKPLACWANGMPTLTVISYVLGEQCPSRITFAITGIIGIFMAYFTFKKLQTTKW
jgi:uncharacterized membrane protein YuzA (DUF378 family)